MGGTGKKASGAVAGVSEELTRAQKRNVEALNNVIENNLKDHDFSGTLRDLQGNPIPKPSGGFWDHKTEMIQSYDALQGVKKGLEGSLKNPNLNSTVKEFLEAEFAKANFYINKIEELFKPFGGIR
ncbi:polymorphic toxin type 28 domain-containing protein [Bacillus aquiflavi]|uniref:polymorphic toxin type 28 domain-containing protein n=1 Tax=Bacillus aquiflavi TaxID=2672567 RepID=UPI001C553FD7|nr:polymorphic toxin type 28 domain-containing protein [Bacillus aquiflavi]